MGSSFIDRKVKQESEEHPVGVRIASVSQGCQERN